MHARELLELGALVAVHGPTLIHYGEAIPTADLAQYWTASRCRLERWSRALRHYLPATTPGELETARNWSRLRPLLEEILASELLTRTWAAVATAYDRLHGQSELEPLARSILISHQEARNRALNIMVHGQGFSAADAADLNRLRRRLERWCDMLLAHLAPDVDVRDFAFDVERAGEFADDLAGERSSAAVDLTWQLVLASLRASLQTGLADRSPNADLNQQIGGSILRLFREDAAADVRWPESLWLERLAHTANDTQGMIDELLALDETGVL